MMIAMALLLTSLPAIADQITGRIYATVGKPHADYTKAGIKVSAWRIATGSYGEWDSDSSLGDLSVWAQSDGSVAANISMSEIYDRIRTNNIGSYSSTTYEDGTTTINGLGEGVYLVKVTVGPSGLKTKPLLVSIPAKNGDAIVSAGFTGEWEGDKQNGQVTVTIGSKDSNFDRQGIRLDAYLIATGDYYYWKTLSPFETFAREGFTYDTTYGISLKNGANFLSANMDDLEKIIVDNGIKPTRQAISDEDGRVYFKNLRWGIYYISLGNGPKGLEMTDMLVSVPDLDKKASTVINSKVEYTGAKIQINDDEEPKKTIKMLIVPTRRGERLHEIDEYETALGLGNIQMHVGVCFE